MCCVVVMMQVSIFGYDILVDVYEGLSTIDDTVFNWAVVVHCWHLCQLKHHRAVVPTVAALTAFMSLVEDKIVDDELTRQAEEVVDKTRSSTGQRQVYNLDDWCVMCSTLVVALLVIGCL